MTTASASSASAAPRTPPIGGRVWGVLVLAGAAAFAAQLVVGNGAKAWQAYLMHWLLFSAAAHGALLFSALMHTVHARWSRPLEAVAEAFGAFFPVSLLLFGILFLGRGELFPWVGHDLHGKEAWLNLPFLFGRDLTGLVILYLLGLAYLYYTLWFRLRDRSAQGPLGRALQRRWRRRPPDARKFENRRSVLAILYLLAFALVLSLLGYDLVMSMDPHWYSTLFGAYTFIKAVYVGFGALIVTAAAIHLNRRSGLRLAPDQFHDIGKLFFAFGLVWADFFYAQFVVIWYGNIPEETAYIIERTMTAPWSGLAWTVLGICFIAPFLILLNKKIKTVPIAMIVLCAAVIIGMWLEHFLLLGPIYYPGAETLPLGWSDAVIGLGFLGALGVSLRFYFRQVPEALRNPGRGRQ